jgi:hypothetical protein
VFLSLTISFCENDTKLKKNDIISWSNLEAIACNLEAMVALRCHSGTVYWDLTFIRYIQDWELGSLMDLLEFLYAKPRLGIGEDTICCGEDKSK